jgi:DNA replication licensing factor MCM6
MHKLRELQTTNIGHLIQIQGTVTRTTEVKPELCLGTFKCEECNTVNVDVVQQFKFTEPSRCCSDNCMNQTKFELLHKQSVFMDWQKLRVQEGSNDIPAGSMPRSIDVILRGETVDLAKPGDKSIFTGSLVAVPDVVKLLKPGSKPMASHGDSSQMRKDVNKNSDGITGLKQLGVRDLSYRLVFIANSVHS